MSEITTGIMTLEDVDAVYDIECKCFHKPWSRQAFVREVTENACARYMVVRENGVAIAYAGVWFVLFEGQITNIAVHPDKRGQGYGEMVTKAMIQMAADCGMTSLTLEVRKSNEVAQNLYRKLGFVAVGCRRNYYENSEDAILMTLEKLPEGDPENDLFLVYEEDPEEDADGAAAGNRL